MADCSESGLCFNEANESFTTYEERFAHFIEASGIEEGKQRAVFLSVVGAKTVSLLTYLVAPKKPSETPLADILKALRDFYVPKKNVVSERYSFRARKQQSGESVAEYVAALTGLAASCEFGLTLEEQLRDQLVYGTSSEELRTKLLSAAHGEQLNWAKVMDIVNNFECTTTSLRTFQQTPLRTDSVSSHEGKACARGTAEKTRHREEILGARETTFNTCLGEEHPARETANQGNSSGRRCSFTESTTTEGDTLYIAKEPASMGPRATGLKSQSALGDSRRPPGSSSQTDLEEPKKDDRIQGANKISPGNPAIYKLNLTSTENDQVCIKDFGSQVLGKCNKTIMLLGATGSGKTTLINGMINYILGVEWKDEWRFKLIDEVTNKTQAESQTSEVTAYQIHHNEGFKVPYSLTIIDTPGFGDTRGIKQDKEITEKIRQFFTRQDGIASIDAVCFVVQSALARLTHTQKYIFEAVLSIFGKDIASNIISMVTFADGQKPPVLEAIRAADIPCATKEGSLLHFKFNNSALYASNEQSDDSFDQMFWNLGKKSMNGFFNSLNTMETRSLLLTKEVLSERKQLEATVAGVQPLIQIGLAKLNEIQETRAALHRHQSAINANKDFTYEVEISVANKVDLETGVYVTNCLKCNYTCHDDCAYANDDDKINCMVMKNSYCTVCPGKCIWSVHHNMTYKIVTEMKKETRTYENLKKEYEKAQGKKMSAEEIVKQLEQEYEDVQFNVFQRTDEMARSLRRLQEIALRPDPLSTPGYIELLIEAEKQECKPGYKKRVAELENVLEGAVIVNQVAKGEPLTDQEHKMLPIEAEKQECKPLTNQEHKMSLSSRFQTWLGLQTKK
ncbi:uncharacterized protein LOC118206358 [Anguilla anguilla]|uniref:uncharacterized protein LOC118206358 n=1 Tax=Anguilla anguilla TaxID=7936 RepID=UPI0015B11383|nr:uncharacterized protein LOC118206358 [Anguilla anguilla]